MRVLLMILLLANFGFFAWQHWHGGNGGALPEGRIDQDLGKGLVLVGEAAPQTEETAVAATAPAARETMQDAPTSPLEESGVDGTAPVATACATLGPFDTAEAATAARERLVALGHAAAVRETGGQIRSGFWVYLPPFESRGAAKEVENELRARGVRDLFIVTASENENAISLGLFSTPERADQRAAEIGRLGYSPRVAERFRDATVHWVDFRERTGMPLEPEAVGVSGADDTLPEKRPIDCADVALGNAGP